MDFYDRRGDYEKAKYWAKEILIFPSKIKNMESERLKKRANDYMRSHKQDY
jgi:hypothetical protein